MDFLQRLPLFFMVLPGLALRSHSQGLCPSNWIYLHGSCYKFSTKTSNFNAAKSACKAQGSMLAVVKSKAENQAITSRLTKPETYIGLYRDPKDPSKWLWVDGTHATYTNWDKGHGQPNNKQANIEDCVVIWKSGAWHDAPCNNQNRYYSVCKTEGFCPNNWIYLHGSCYKFSTKTSNFKAAKSACKAQGSMLAVVKSKDENQAITSRLTKPETYIGLYRDPKDPSKWLWVDGTRATYTNWDKGYGQPNNKQANVEDCVVIWKSGAWHDAPCNNQNRYYSVCETEDINECALFNGGCSHKCVNTAGGYKCGCPDPELSLASDNKTCHGVNVQCNSENMTVIIPKSLLRGMDREHLRLLDTTCKAADTGAYFSLTTPLTSCNTTSRHTPTAIVYSNAVLEIPLAAQDVVTRVREIEIQFSCFYSKYGVVSSVGWKPNDRKLVFSDEGHGNFTLSLHMFPGKRFVNPYMKSDFPVAVVLRKRLFFEVSVTSGDKQLSIRAAQCFATPSQNPKNPLKYEFIRKGCPYDATLKYHSGPAVSTQRFSLEAFKFIADHPFVFVHCHVIVCNATDPGSNCVKRCSFSGRGRREVGDHVTDIYSLAQGPLYQAREKREEKSGIVLDENGSSAIMMVLFVMGVAVLAGTAVMIFKRSREPVGYTMLANGDQN